MQMQELTIKYYLNMRSIALSLDFLAVPVLLIYQLHQDCCWNFMCYRLHGMQTQEFSEN